MANTEVTIIVNTLNDELRELDNFFSSLIRNEPAEIIVVDGGSTDGTLNIASKYTKSIYITAPNMVKQHLFALKKVKTKYVLIAATDHELPENFITKLSNELIENKCFGVQSKLICKYERNFFEKGQKFFMSLLHENLKYIDVPTCPCILNVKEYIPIIEDLMKIEIFSYCTDTLKADILKKRKLKVLNSKFFAYQVEKLNYGVYSKKMFAYGNGDWDYYKINKNHWTLKRKLMSITYVFRKYFLYYPYKCLFRPVAYIAIPFFWLTALLRYYGFFRSIVLDKYYNKTKI